MGIDAFWKDQWKYWSKLNSYISLGTKSHCVAYDDFAFNVLTLLLEFERMGMTSGAIRYIKMVMFKRSARMMPKIGQYCKEDHKRWLQCVQKHVSKLWERFTRRIVTSKQSTIQNTSFILKNVFYPTFVKRAGLVTVHHFIFDRTSIFICRLPANTSFAQQPFWVWHSKCHNCRRSIHCHFVPLHLLSSTMDKYIHIHLSLSLSLSMYAIGLTYNIFLVSCLWLCTAIVIRNTWPF